MPQAIGFAVLGLAGIAGASAATAIAVGNLVIAGISFGANVIIGRIFSPKAGASKPSDGLQEIKQAIPPRRKSYGQVRVAGTVFFSEVQPTELDVLFHGVSINSGRIAEYVELFIDDTVVTIDPVTGAATSSPFANVDDPVYFYTRLGLATETAYSQLNTHFSIADARGDGVATILGEFDNREDGTRQLELYPSGLPLVRATIKASVCYDPRVPAHDRLDETTWEWTENPIVALLNYVLDADGFAIPWERVEPNLAEWIAAMNVCEEQIDLVAGGTEDRYRVAGSFDFSARPVDIAAQILSTCDGRMWQRRNGTIGVGAGKFEPPTVAIVSDDILAYTIERGQDQLTSIAGLRAQYMSPDNGYREEEAEPWPTGEVVLALGEDRVDTLDFTWVPSGTQCRRLMKREYIRRTAEWRGTISTNMAGLRAMDERFITLTIDDLGISETFEVDKFTFDPSSMTCQLQVASVGAEIDDWTPATEEGAA